MEPEGSVVLEVLVNVGTFKKNLLLLFFFFTSFEIKKKLISWTKNEI